MTTVPFTILLTVPRHLRADSRHRILHTMWEVNEVIVPIFGHTLINSDGNEVDVKDMCERNHLLVDFSHKFIPTLNDFVDAIEVNEVAC